MRLDRARIVDLIHDSCRLLDAEDYAGYISLCAPGFSYRITTFSEELRKPLEWMHQEREALLTLLETIKNHERSIAHLRRVAAMVRIGERQGERVPVETTVTIYHTWHDGETRLFAVGTYHDQVTLAGSRPLLAERTMVLDTRRLPSGSHLPL